MNNQILQTIDFCNFLDITFEQNLHWYKHITSIATAAVKKLGYLFRTRKLFSSTNLYTLCTSQIKRNLEYCFNIWVAASISTFNILDFIQRRAVRLIGDIELLAICPSTTGTTTDLLQLIGMHYLQD